MPWSRVRPELDEPQYLSETAGGRRVAYAEAIREALAQAMELDERVFVMGQGVDAPDAMFGTTLGLKQKFGPERVFDTPLAENGLMGVAVGAALGGRRPVYMHNRPDFLLLAMDQIVNHAAKWHFMFGGASRVPLVIWACIGRGWGSAAQHSQALQGLFLHVPGLKLVMPSTCYDAKGLLLAAIADNNPVLVLDHRLNFRHRGMVPEKPYLVELGKGIVRRAGKHVTIVAVSHMVHEAFTAATELSVAGIEAEIIDLRSLRPLDESLILASLARTGRLIVADCGWRTGGVCAEVMAVAAEKGFALLKAPVRRIASPDLPTPAGFTLEQGYYTGAAEIVAAAREICVMKEKIQEPV
jgi:pyruvate dehydrogenase E1 component beta subunit